MREAVEKLMGLAREVVETREQIDWKALDAATVKAWLQECPEMWCVIRWGMLSKEAWLELLMTNNAPARLCPFFDKFSGDEWMRLLSSRPNMSEYCDWSKLDGMDWVGLLQEFPDFYKHCPKEKLTGADWASLLKTKADWVEADCEWSKLSGEDWAELLVQTNSFDGKCDWSELSEEDWKKVLSCRPELEKFKKN